MYVGNNEGETPPRAALIMARPKHTEKCGYFGKHENVNTDNIRETVKEYNVITERAKRYAMARREAWGNGVESIQPLIDRLQEYTEKTIADGKPLTVAGYILAAGVPASKFYDMKNGTYDHIIEEFKICNDLAPDTEQYITPDGEVIPLVPFSDIIEKCYLLIQEQRETACSSLRGNPAGNIFLLKAQQGFREEESPSTVNQTLVIADSEQARHALDLLK